MKSITILCFTFLAVVCHASEDVEKITPILTEPVEIVLVCPEGSKHEGDELPHWASTEEAAKFFCNETVEETEIAE